MLYYAIPLVLIILPIMLSCFPIMPDAKQSVYDSSDRGGALSRSSNDTDDVDSGVSPEHVHAQDSQESDVVISFLCFVQGFNYGIGALRMRNGRMGVSTIMLKIMLMLIASIVLKIMPAYCARAYCAHHSCR